jgi:hypothetical protein
MSFISNFLRSKNPVQTTANIVNPPLQAIEVNENECNDKIRKVFSEIGFIKTSLDSIMRTFNIWTNRGVDLNDFKFRLFQKESKDSKYTLLGKNITSFKISDSHSTDTDQAYRYTLKDDENLYYITESKDKSKASLEYPFYFLQSYHEKNEEIYISGGKNKTKQNKTKQNKTKQNKTKQNKTKQNKTKQSKTYQKN